MVELFIDNAAFFRLYKSLFTLYHEKAIIVMALPGWRKDSRHQRSSQLKEGVHLYMECKVSMRLLLLLKVVVLEHARSDGTDVREDGELEAMIMLVRRILWSLRLDLRTPEVGW